MSFRDLAQIQLQNLIGGPNQLAGRPVGLHTPPSVPPTVIPLVIDWSQYNPSFTSREIGVRIDLSATNQAQPGLDKVRSIKIDNSYCSVPIYVQFSDTLDTVVCPAYSIVVTAVYTNALNCVVYGTEFFTGRPPQTTIEFCNFDRQGLILSDISPDAVKVNFINSYSINAAASAFSQNVTTPYTFPPDAILLVAFAIHSTAAGTDILTSATFNALAMAGDATVQGGSGALHIGARMMYRAVPALAAGTYALAGVVNAAVNGLTAHVFMLSNWTQATPFLGSNTLQDTALVTKNLAVPVPQPVPGGVGIFLETENTTTPDIPVWTNATVISSRVNTTVNIESTCALATFLDTDAIAVAANGLALIGNLWI